MIPQTQCLTTHLLPSIVPTTHFPQFSLPLSQLKPLHKIHFITPKANPFYKHLLQSPRCSVSVVSEPAHLGSTNSTKPYPAEVSRTIMELSSVGTLSTLNQDGWPLGIGVRFAVDPEGTPILCLNASSRKFSLDRRSSLHVQLEQCGLRTPQCTIEGSLDKPEDRVFLKKLQTIWNKRFEEEVDEDLIYVVSVERVLQIEDFTEDGLWVTSSDYKLANPDPLRDFAEKFVEEINEHNMEDVCRFCNIYVDLDFQVSKARIVWVDRLGFDMRLSSPQDDVFEVRVPFPREVTDEKGAKSSFNCMSQLAWEVERSYQVPDFTKVNKLKKITRRGH
ncbi:hypothetical protein RJ639_034773 [Escallonia herrerae]|uniref:DUF2470 domain-containing protein n=1 Tax=Escallonia herrerae TaxID=1293975 RepID=A0AA88WWM7_9ASTE|nr:hypothetical protein RJ639_034773 [Escallonia herrerae]